ncbi:MAG: 1,6-anhydro-N-acetylmuramyl-L-alanine amidase AmpD [Pseudomonadota bacterium]
MADLIDGDGWHRGARRIDSPNFDDRPDGCEPELLVVHNISLPPGRFGTGAIEALFCNRLDCTAHEYYPRLEGLRVSAHFLIDRLGGLTQFVSCSCRAWHAGVSSWAGRSRCNDFSLGVELEGTDTQAYEDAQYEALVALVDALRRRYPSLNAASIVGHSDIAPGRKTDPGPGFSWSRLRSDLRRRNSASS